MIKVALNKPVEEIDLKSISEGTLIFAKKKDKIEGVLIKERERGWIVKIGGEFGSFGYKDTREECIEIGMKRHGYEFFIEE